MPHHARSRLRPARLVFAGLLAAGLALGCAAPEPPPVADEGTRRTTSLGEVRGFVTADGAHAWRGIPFARPPVGELRWRAPRPPEPWTGVRDTLEHASPCVQYGGPLAGTGSRGEPAGSEDCLYLNVYAPAMDAVKLARLDPRLPVMVWIHGGGNTIGSANIYDGSVLATRESVIVVTVNYRLGVLGWFSHPALHRRDESADDRSGNYGTLDLVRALAWVRDEIAAFGGDPSRVTIFGESAGGRNVFSLMLSPRAEGLFHHAIVQSGGLRRTTMASARNPVDAEPPGHERSSAEVVYALLEARGEARDRAAAREVVAGMTPGEIEALLRGASGEELLRLFDGRRLGGMYALPQVLNDGAVLRDVEPLSLLAAGRYNRVPVIVGSTRDETRLFSMMGSEFVTRVFGIPVWLNDERRYQLENEYPSLMWKAIGVDQPAAAMRGVQGPSVYGYRFDWDEEPKRLTADFSKLLGAAHGLEVPFVFGKLSFFGLERMIFDAERLPAAEELARAMVSYWGQFAWTGDPGHGSTGRLPRWRPWDDSSAGAPRYLIFDTPEGGGLRMSSDVVDRREVIARIGRDERFRDAAERCAVYRSFVERGETMKPAEYAQVDDGACRAYPLETPPAG